MLWIKFLSGRHRHCFQGPGFLLTDCFYKDRNEQLFVIYTFSLLLNSSVTPYWNGTNMEREQVCYD